MKFTKDHIKPGMQYKFYHYPGTWATDIVISVTDGKVFTKQFNKPHLIHEFIQKMNDGLEKPVKVGKLMYFKLVEKKVARLNK